MRIHIESDQGESDLMRVSFQEQHAALAECHSKVHANQLDLASQQLGGITVQAASEAGCAGMRMQEYPWIKGAQGP